jgi:hypothetical protein
LKQKHKDEDADQVMERVYDDGRSDPAEVPRQAEKNRERQKHYQEQNPSFDMR